MSRTESDRILALRELEFAKLAMYSDLFGASRCLLPVSFNAKTGRTT